MSIYSCEGIKMPQPEYAPEEGLVGCYRAGHRCPTKVATVTTSETHRMTSWHCPCCGDGGASFCVPLNLIEEEQ
jgi:hypothetical protein